MLSVVIYIRIQSSYAYSVYSYNRISGKLAATVNLINFLGGWLAYEYTDRLTAVDSHRGGTIKWYNLLQIDRLGTKHRVLAASYYT